MNHPRSSSCCWTLAAAVVCPLPVPAAESAPTKPPPAFIDVTQESGVAQAITRHYAEHPKWWLSGLNLVALDSDGQLDLFFAAHGAGQSLAMLGDGHGHFQRAEGSYTTLVMSEE